MISILSDIYPLLYPFLFFLMYTHFWVEVGSLDHMVILFLMFWGKLHTVFQSNFTIYICTNSVEGFLFAWYLSCIKTKYFILKLCVSWSESIKTSTLFYKISQKGSKRSTLGFVSLSLCVSVFCTTHSQSNSPLFEWV